MNLYPAAAIARHIVTSRSTAGHGVHSPFVYDFLATVVRAKTDAAIIDTVESLRSEMQSDRTIIRITDLGAGPVRLKGAERRISHIAETASLPGKETAFLARIAGDTACNVQREGIILELGTSLGISTLALALAAPSYRVITVEGCPVLAAIAVCNLKNHGAENADVLNMEFTEALDRLAGEGTKVRMAFIDGNHRGSALRDYIEKIAGMGDEMIIVADDIHLSKDMYRAWRSVIHSPEAPAAIETMRLGIIFRINRITPGHYRIRY